MGRGGSEHSPSSRLLYGESIPRCRYGAAGKRQPTQLLIVLELSDRSTGELVESIYVDASDARISDVELRVLANDNWDSDLVPKLLDEFAGKDAGAAEALRRVRSSEHKWSGCRLDEESAIAWCAHKGIDLG